MKIQSLLVHFYKIKHFSGLETLQKQKDTGQPSTDTSNTYKLKEQNNLH